MRDAIVKYGLFYGALLVVGVAAWKLTSIATDANGGNGTSLLNSTSVGLSAVTGIAAVLIAAGTGLLAGRLVSARGGLIDMGVVLAWGAYGYGTLREIVMARANAQTGAGTRAVLTMLTVEAALVGALVVAAAWFIERTAKRDPAEQPDTRDRPAVTAALTTFFCGVVGGAAGVWLLAQTGYKGQVIGAALAGGVVGGVLAYALDHHVRLWPLLAGCVAVSVAGPVVALIGGKGDASLYASIVAGSVPRWAQLTGLDGAAGACMGVPVGLYIAKGLLGHAGRVAEDAR
ncbi:MAG TPA: hypothetical protein VFF65_09870 [Phycisphaerales bacterium]|nr:hypothetical protein [Phycisphaerales bacterium]